MLNCYITRTGSYLPGSPIDNNNLHKYLGRVLGESWVRDKILSLNGIRSRHYALDEKQNATHDIYELAAEAVSNCLNKDEIIIDYLSAGATNTPLVAPGLSTMLHDRLRKNEVLNYPLEINSNSGICSSGAQAFVSAARAVRSGDANAAVCVGVDQPSAILNSKVFRPVYDLPAIVKNIRNSKWFMSVFLRFMLSDGAGACLLRNKPNSEGFSFQVDWTYSRSFANEAPLCMKLESKTLTLSQNVHILSKYMAPFGKKVLTEALLKNKETINNYTTILPHMSSYFFESSIKKTIKQLSNGTEVPYWTNLHSAGNTGSASVYVMLDEFIRKKKIKRGQRLLLFVPESGQFNYVIVSLTVV